MPTNQYLPNKDAELSTWLGTFTTVAQANLSTLKLTTADIQTIVTDTTNFNSGTSAVVAAHNAAKVATKSRATSRKKAVSDTRALVKRIQGTPGISDTLKQQLGINVSAGRRPVVPVYQPTPLSAIPQPDMTISLKWGKNTNHYGTLYVIERKCGTDTTWTMVDKITATRYSDGGCVPGTTATYRVTATRGDLVSMPSPQAIVYPKDS